MEFKNLPKVLGLDVSTKTIGWALFNMVDKQLLELTHFSPIVKPKPQYKIEEHLKKAEAFEEKLKEVKDLGIVEVIIEEPLLTSNNLYTVGTLLRYNAMIVKTVYDVLGIIPKFVSTYNARKYAFPQLVRENGKGKKVLFGKYPKGCDKKKIIWEEVRKLEPNIVWAYTRNQTLKKESFDMTDAYACVLGHMKQEGIW
jgi:RNase H-fold protein (predicted Holliday junction resolvase)|tara:strand:- start:988 stop:1581 length:594 start_codon:yes stop_codon:yes gene_type:complete